MNQLPAVLCVDDEFTVLKGIERVLSTRFKVTAVATGADALVALEYGGPFAAVVSDFRLLETDGIRLLARARELAPLTARVLLTGRATMDDAVAAINDGHIFAYVRKPCRPELLLERVSEAVAHHERALAEKELLENTLSGSIKALTELLALTCPVAAGRALRLARIAGELAVEVRAERWPVEMAAMLSQVGCVTIAPELAERICRGALLTPQEQEVSARLPLVAERILATIPRLETVREILRRMGEPCGDAADSSLPVGSRILRIAADFDLSESRGATAPEIVAAMSAAPNVYDPSIVSPLTKIARYVGAHVATVDMPLSAVEQGMVFASDVHSPLHLLLIARGQDVTTGILERIRNHWAPFADHTMVRLFVS